MENSRPNRFRPGISMAHVYSIAHRMKAEIELLDLMSSPEDVEASQTRLTEFNESCKEAWIEERGISDCRALVGDFQ
jgi:hypothetical protein